MTNIVAILNQKGGVGKTTTAVNMSACLGNLGYKTLLIDADPQSNSSISYGIEAKAIEHTFYNFLILGEPNKPIVKKTMIPNLDIFPTDDNLYAADLDLIQLDNNGYGVLKKRLNGNVEAYDFVIIDSPPHLGPLTINIMKASDTLVVPLKADFLALQGLAILHKTYERIKRSINPDLRLLGILLTMYNGTLNICKDVEKDVKKHFGKYVFENKIPQNVTIAESPSFAVPVTVHGPKSLGAISYQNFTLEFLKKIYEAPEDT
ncbi:MAG: ParA family protein [Clostridiales Family XIII bacterium]|jgi:chromosome partitioning protein|nr:ParA family protein [Clostridiales Family XIII bacterium]